MATNQYTVQPGDTVNSIAQDPAQADAIKQSGVTNLLPGQKVDMPATTGTPAPSSTTVGGQATPAIPLSFGDQLAQNPTPTPTVPGQVSPTPLEALPLAGTPQQPTYARPGMQGGNQTFALFDRMVAGTVDMTNQNPLTAPEKEAYAMYNNYKKYNTADSKTLYDAIQKGDVTPDAENVLWRAISNGGEPTKAMVEAFGWWKTAQERNASGVRSADPFLGGSFPKPTSIEEAESLVNQNQKNMADGGNGADMYGDITDTSFSASEMDEFASEIRAMVNLAGPAAPEYEKRLLQLRGEYNVDNLEGELNNLYKEYSDMEAITRQRLQYQEDQPVAMNVISGRMTEVQRQQKERLDYLGREIQYRNSMVQTANSAIESLMNAKQLDYGVARTQWQDSVNAAKGLMQEFNTMRQSEMDYMTAQREEASANLTSYYNLITEGTMDTSKISSGEMQQIAKMEMMAGMPVGTFMNLYSKNPSAEVRTQVERYDAEGNRYFDVIMQDRKTGRPFVQTISAGFDASKAQDLAMGALDISGKVLDNQGQLVDNALKEDDLLYNRPLERDKTRMDISKSAMDMQNTQSIMQSRALNDQKTSLDIASDYNVSGPSANANTGDYLANYGAITGPNGSPLWKYGLDVDLKVGDPVYSPVTGEVVKVGNNGGFGNQVQVRGADGNTVWLSHLQGANVKVGDKVSAGAQVGTGGNSGNTIPGKGGDGSHLDITIKKADGSYFSAPEVQKYISGNYSSQVKAGTSVTKNKTPTATESTTSLRDNVIGKAEQFTGKDGKLSPDDYNALRTAWVQQGQSTSSFDSFMSKYVNPTQRALYSSSGKDYEKAMETISTGLPNLTNATKNIVKSFTSPNLTEEQKQQAQGEGNFFTNLFN